MSFNSHNLIFSRSEEWLNAVSHFLGIILGIVALVLLTIKSVNSGFVINVISCAIFSVSIIILYSSSTLYHVLKEGKIKQIFRTLDHLSIYLLIAGTYTPVALIMIKNPYGWIIFTVLWSLVGLGVLYKLFFFHAGWLSTFIYILMGWTALGFIVQVVEALPLGALMLILLGGVIYTSGTIFYMLDDQIKYCHALWHLFVLLGTFCHFLAIYFYMAGMHILN
ncbi:hemolysin III family protein [Thiotrichales bacterium 19S11-10]|nr:hemolysin III family protein [Thiotrichales bacterium 19S11-10]